MTTVEYINATVAGYVKPAAAAGMLLMTGAALTWTALLCAAWVKRRTARVIGKKKDQPLADLIQEGNPALQRR